MCFIHFDGLDACMRRTTDVMYQLVTTVDVRASIRSRPLTTHMKPIAR